MIFTSFDEFNYNELKNYSDILADETFSLSKDSGGIRIMKFHPEPRWNGQYLFMSSIYQLWGQCGVAILSSIPIDRERFGMLLPVAEALCDAYGYNTLMISTNHENNVKIYEEFGFKRIWSNINRHTGYVITILCKDMKLPREEDEDDEYEEDEYEQEDWS